MKNLLLLVILVYLSSCVVPLNDKDLEKEVQLLRSQNDSLTTVLEEIKAREEANLKRAIYLEELSKDSAAWKHYRDSLKGNRGKESNHEE